MRWIRIVTVVTGVRGKRVLHCLNSLLLLFSTQETQTEKGKNVEEKQK